MAKTLVIYYSRSGENYVNGSVKNLAKGLWFTAQMQRVRREQLPLGRRRTCSD